MLTSSSWPLPCSSSTPQYPHCHALIYQLHFITIRHSMHGRHPHLSSPSSFLSLVDILIPHPRARNLVYLAAHHARVQLVSTRTPKAARLHACVPCTQAAPSLIFFLLHAPRWQGPCSSLATITRSSHAGIRTSRHGGNISWMPRDCRHCSSLHGAAGGGSFLWGWYPGGGASYEGDEVLGLRRSPTQSCWWNHVISNKWAVRGNDALGLPMMRIDLGFSGLDPDERSKLVMKVMGALGLPMARTLGLSWSPGPKVADERPHCSLSQSPSWPESMLS